MGEEMKIEKVEGGLLHLANGNTMPVSNKVNPKFIKAGMAEVSQIDGVVTFIKMIKSEQTPQKASSQDSNYRTPKEIAKQACLDSAIVASSKDAERTAESILLLADKLYVWVSAE